MDRKKQTAGKSKDSGPLSRDVKTTVPKPGFLEQSTALQLFLIIALPLMLYGRVVNFEFIDFDDKAIILDKQETLSNFNNIWELFKTDAFLNRNGNSFYRPIQNISFMIDASISGTAPWMYHLSNIIIHIITCLSLFYCLLLLGNRKLIALACTCLFSVHPLFASAVSWVPARGDLLIGLEGLLLFICFLLYEQSGKWQYLVLHILLFTFAIFTKETAVLFPVLLVTYYWLILKKRKLSRLLIYAACWGFVFVLYFILRGQVMQQAKYPPDVFGILPFFKNLPALPITFWKFFVPHALSTMPLFDMAATIMGCLLILVAAFITLRKAKEGNWMPAWGLVWMTAFFATPLFYRLGFAQYKYTYFEFRTYLPMIGLLISICYMVDKLPVAKLKLLSLPTIMVILFFGILSFKHSDDYRNTLNFFGSGIRFNNPGAYMLRGMAYADLKQTSDAKADFDTTISLAPDFIDAYINRGKFRSEVEFDYKGAEEDFSTVIRDYKPSIETDSTLTNTFIKRSVARKYLQDFSGALQDLNHAKQLNPQSAEVYYRYGNLYSAQKKYDSALVNFEKALELNSDYAEVYNNRATVFYFMHDLLRAAKDYKKAIEINPEYINAYNSLGAVYIDLNKQNEAISCFDNVIRLAPDNIDAYYKKGKAFQAIKDSNAACRVWKQALQLRQSNIKDTVARYCK